MSSTSINRLHVIRAVAPITAALVIVGLGGTPSSAQPDPGPHIPPTDHAGECQLQRVGTQFVSCDNLTGNGVAAPGWIPRAGAAAPRQSVPTSDASRGPSLATSRKVVRSTTSGSAAGGFAWSSDERFETTVDCDTFDAHVTASVTDRYTLMLDSDGTISTFTESVSAPSSVWTNTKTGASAVVRGQYGQVASRIPGTQEFNRRVTGTSSMVGQPGGASNTVGHTVRDESPWSDLTGQHRFADAMLTQSTLCAAIA